jgi:glycosyltransferase involved in cell wall biosynthesis
MSDPHPLVETVDPKIQVKASVDSPLRNGTSNSGGYVPNDSTLGRLRGRRAAVVMFSHYPSDPRPRRAAEALAQQGMSVEVISLQQNEGELRRETFGGVNILRVPFKRRRGGKFAYVIQYFSFIFVSFVLLACRSLTRRYALVHVHNMPDILVTAALVPKVLGAKVILDIHDPMPELMTTIFGMDRKSFGVRFLKLMEKWSISFADVVLTVNMACKKLLSDRSCPLEKVRVVMNSPDEQIFRFQPLAGPGSPKRDATKPFVLMYHGSLVERHGLDIAVSALRLIKPVIPNIELRVYGQKTPFLEQVLDSLQGFDLQKIVHYLGPKNLEQIVEAIDECDVGIIPNRRSIFTEINTPTRIFEYLSRGKPVIAPATPGIQDYFNRHQLMLFELGDANDLARSIEYVFSHPIEVERVVKRGQEVYLEHRWSCDRKKFVNLVGDLIMPSVIKN